jgi:threonine aldolase
MMAPRQSNAVFVKIPPKLVKALRKSFFFYVWDEVSFECRLMTSWDTQREDIENFAQNLRLLLSANQTLHGEQNEISSDSLS